MYIWLTKQSKDCKHFNFCQVLRWNVSLYTKVFIQEHIYSIRRNLMDRCSRSINMFSRCNVRNVKCTSYSSKDIKFSIESYNLYETITKVIKLHFFPFTFIRPKIRLELMDWSGQWIKDVNITFIFSWTIRYMLVDRTV